MLIPEMLNLEALRKNAKISQEEMASRLNLSQSQVCRYEQAPDDVPHGVIRKWLGICGQLSSPDGLPLNDPYEEIVSKIGLVSKYVSTAPAPLQDKLFHNPPTAENLMNSIRKSGRKPRLALCGRFDMGKSRMANTLMGGDKLPTSYQPATSIICLVRHMKDRPAWQPEEVWIMRKGFDLDRADDKDHCLKHKIIAGSFDTLKRYGTHNEENDPRTGQCYAAVVYINAPILLGCDIVDFPGYGHSNDDHSKAEFAQHLADIVIYASTANGFLDHNDLQFAGSLLRQLPPVETKSNGLPSLSNFYFVATRSDMSNEELNQILSKASNRAFHHLKENLDNRGVDSGVPIELENFRKRFFTFQVENQDRRREFENDLQSLLSSIYPRLVQAKLDQNIARLKSAAKHYCDSWAAKLTEALENQTKAQESLKTIEAAEPQRQQRIRQKRERILGIIEKDKEQVRQFINETLASHITVDAIEKTIRERYNEKKEAQSLAASYVTEHVQNKLNKKLAALSQNLTPEIHNILQDYQNSAHAGEGIQLSEITIPFNAEGAFLAALAAAGTVGGLAVWASIAAAGSNLGAYILIPTVVSFLSSLGISLGGTAATISVIAAMGGPITIALALGAAVATLVFALFGPSWQTRLARKISKTLSEEGFLEKLAEHADKFWNDTKQGFEISLDATEKAFQDSIKFLRELATATSPEQISQLIKQVVETRDFFAGIPWRLGS